MTCHAIFARFEFTRALEKEKKKHGWRLRWNYNAITWSFIPHWGIAKNGSKKTSGLLFRVRVRLWTQRGQWCKIAAVSLTRRYFLIRSKGNCALWCYHNWEFTLKGIKDGSFLKKRNTSVLYSKKKNATNLANARLWGKSVWTGDGDAIDPMIS